MSLEIEYKTACETPSDINEHLPILFEYGKRVNHITELGVRTGVSTRAFLYSNPEKMISYDVNPNIHFNHVGFKNMSETDYNLIIADSLMIEIEETDLLFIDTYHSYDQLSKELELHGDKVRKYIIIHDTETFGEIGMDKKRPGMLKAVFEFVYKTDWIIKKRFKNNNGLIILERQK